MAQYESQELADQVTLIDGRLRTRLRKGVDRVERQALAKLLIRLQENLEDSLHPDPQSDAGDARTHRPDPPTGTR